MENQMQKDITDYIDTGKVTSIMVLSSLYI